MTLAENESYRGVSEDAALDKAIRDLLQTTAEAHTSLYHAFDVSKKWHVLSPEDALQPDLAKRIRELVEAAYRKKSEVFEIDRRILVEPLVIGIKESAGITLDEVQRNSLVAAVLRDPAEAWRIVIGSDPEKITQWLSGYVTSEF